MKLRLIQVFIMLLGGLITCVISIINNYSLDYSLQILLVVLIIFYFIGLLARLSLLRIIKNKKLNNKLDNTEVIDELNNKENKA
ncbi:hypothetical protein EDC18_104226 [Natranaerovirga pectinivora]|uniref:Uncharacterized protein n=1 Tax=Natranaerovirga pectinivora TaxID=682400 RepID=A0A4R3MLZ6_9FIRM|nr:hypothetical protein [Natranaerovirga pectinivora]TCT15076.1 hypothetical protein EDC18_104226 [Natranaerovirga pectinivora]